MGKSVTVRKLGGIAPWFLLFGVGVWLLLPVETGEAYQTVRFAPSMTPIVAPRNLLIIGEYADPYAKVKRAQALYQVFDDQGTVDEALVVGRLQRLVDDILRANNGKTTASVNQLRTKIKYSQALLSRSKRAGVVGAPVDGEFLPSTDLGDRVLRKGAVLGQILSGRKLVGAVEYEPNALPGLKPGGQLILKDVHLTGFPSQTLEMRAGAISTTRITPPQADAARFKLKGSATPSEGQPVAAVDPLAGTDRRATVVKISYLCEFKRRAMTAAELKEARSVLQDRAIAAPDGTVFRYRLDAGEVQLYNWMEEPLGAVLRCRATFSLEAPELVSAANEAARQGRGIEGTMTVVTGKVPRWKRLWR